MRAKEFINEEISLTYLKPKIDQIIKGAIKKCFRVIGRRQFANNEELLSAVENQLATLGDQISQNMYHDQDIFGGIVSFEKMKNVKHGGYASRHNIVLDQTDITELSASIMRHFRNLIGFKKDYTIEDITDNPFVEDRINTISNKIIHELVHIKQHSTQSIDKPTEYRSYLTKNKQEFYDAVSKLETEQDWKLYLSSPQEIPAFAHNFALELIRFLWDNPVENIKDVHVATGVLANINDVFTWKNVVNGMRTHEMYSRFSTPGTKEYKIFKKFMTIAYKELQAFKDRVQDRFEELRMSS
jgi:hypothetical protein